jgi:hypothetical protein
LRTGTPPHAALSLVWNLLLAPRFHREKVTTQNLVATAVIGARRRASPRLCGRGRRHVLSMAHRGCAQAPV